MTRKSTGSVTNVFTCGDLSLDAASHRVTRAGKSIDLSAKEFAVLEFMIRNKGVPPARAIENNVWELRLGGRHQRRGRHMSYLRRKLDADFDKKLIHTVRGRGGLGAEGRGMRFITIKTRVYHLLHAHDDPRRGAGAHFHAHRGQPRAHEQRRGHGCSMSCTTTSTTWEYEGGYLDLDELNLYRHNVYILVYDEQEQLIGGAGLRHFDGDEEFLNGQTRDVTIDGEKYLVYDLYVQNPGGNRLAGASPRRTILFRRRVIVILSCSFPSWCC